MNEQMIVVEEDSLTSAWVRLFLRLMERGVQSLVPSVLTVRILDPKNTEENLKVRAIVDAFMRDQKLPSIETVANTIFPLSLWNRSANRLDLFTRYNKVLPKILRHRGNRHGHYFQRMINYSGEVNQLDKILGTWQEGNHRHSALQVAIFDPQKDHKNSPQWGFPCLHQIAFTPLSERRLAVQAFYATQHLLTKTFGNVVGLTRLGQFMAHEMGLELERVTCIAGRQKLGIPKSLCKDLQVRLLREAGL